MFSCDRFNGNPGSVNKNAASIVQIDKNLVVRKDLPPTLREPKPLLGKEKEMAEPKPGLPSKRRELSKNQALAVMVIGAILLAQVFFFSSEPGSSAHMTRIVVAIIGFVALLVGAYLRPIKADAQGKSTSAK